MESNYGFEVPEFNKQVPLMPEELERKKNEESVMSGARMGRYNIMMQIFSGQDSAIKEKLISAGFTKEKVEKELQNQKN